MWLGWGPAGSKPTVEALTVRCMPRSTNATPEERRDLALCVLCAREKDAIGGDRTIGTTWIFVWEHTDSQTHGKEPILQSRASRSQTLLFPPITSAGAARLGGPFPPHESSLDLQMFGAWFHELATTHALTQHAIIVYRQAKQANSSLILIFKLGVIAIMTSAIRDSSIISALAVSALDRRGERLFACLIQRKLLFFQRHMNMTHTPLVPCCCFLIFPLSFHPLSPSSSSCPPSVLPSLHS